MEANADRVQEQELHQRAVSGVPSPHQKVGPCVSSALCENYGPTNTYRTNYAHPVYCRAFPILRL